MKNVIAIINIAALATLTLFLHILPIQAASFSDSILDIPSNTIFELRDELEISANRNFIILGENQLNASFNQINQTLNQQNGQYGKQYSQNSRHRSSYHYNDYLYQWQETAEQSYQDCLVRHRIYYKNDNNNADNYSNNNTIINSGRNNTNVIINSNTYETPTYGSYQAQNSCIKPEHTMALLLIDKDEADGGGIFKEGYELKVKSVRHRSNGNFHIITINFKHKIAKAIRIITTQPPSTIRIGQLRYTKSGDGFWESLGNALASMTDIGGNHFNIRFPKKHYYD